MLIENRTIIKQKGQGVVEYAVLLAFIVGLAVMLNNFNIASEVKGVFDQVAIVLGGESIEGSAEGNTYASYFSKWRKKTSAWLAENVSSEERLKADQEALGIIARAFIGKDAEGVKDLIKELSVNRSGVAQFNNTNPANYQAGENGWSQTLVPLSYRENDLEIADQNNNYVHLDWSGNVETVKLLSDDAVAYKGAPDGQPQTSPYSVAKNSGVSDRIFYSDGMIGDNANNKMVTLQVHYDNGVVDQVNIQARDVTAGHSDSQRNSNKNTYQTVSGLNLHVTNSGITQLAN